MKVRKIFSAVFGALLISIMCCTAVSVSAAEITPTQPTKGDGSEDKPFEISTAAELYWYADFTNDEETASNEAYAILTADILVNNDILKDNGELNRSKADDFVEWTPIAGIENYSFGSIFDGQGHVISGLYFNDTSKSNIGLFAEITDGTVQNVGIVDSYFNGKANIGGVCGNNNGTIKNCYVLANIKSENDSFIGGICGTNYRTISNCYAAVSLSAYMPNYVGGICGTNYQTISNCYYDKTVYIGSSVGDSGADATEENVEGKTTTEFASGEVTWLLNGTKLVGTRVWGQTLSGDDKDTYPVAYNGTNNVYYDSDNTKYINKTCTADDHKDMSANNGICPVCGKVQAPKKDDNGVYQISNAGELYWFAGFINGDENICTEGVVQDLYANAVLTADITVNKDVLKDDGTLNSGTFTEWTPIGEGYDYYAGVFNGQGHVVSGLYINNMSQDYVGFFQHASGGAVIKNVGVVDSYFNGSYYVGVVCGLSGAKIINCYAVCSVNSGYYIGGICGYNEREITSCYAVCTFNSDGDIGGICGENNGAIKNCYYDSDDYTGDAVGSSDDGAMTENVKGCSSREFMSGKVAYLLNYPYSIGGPAWGQTLGGDNADAYPVAYNGKNNVYYNSDTSQYENKTCTEDDHDDLSESNGICPVCGKIQAPEQDDNKVYQISNAGELYWFAGLVNGDDNVCVGDVEQNTSANAVLTADITVNKDVLKDDGTLNSSMFIEWTPIGNVREFFSGSFDGQGHVISGLYVNNTSMNYVGLFGGIENSVQNVGVVDSYFNGCDKIGGICGENNGGVIVNCYAVCSVNGRSDIGGICGYNNSGEIVNCYAACKVNGEDNIGGVCGANDSTINNCYHDSTVYTGEVIGRTSYYDTLEKAEGKTTTEFASGEVTYLLNKNQEVGVVCAWGQTLSGDNKDTYPVAYNGTNNVYYDSENEKYKNKTCTAADHDDLSESNGICPVCGKISAPKQDDGEVYQISNAGELYWFAGLVNGSKIVCNGDVVQNKSANAVLTADITVNKDVLQDDGTLNTDNKDAFLIWTPIGNDDDPFTGSFDGQGHVISGLYVNNTSIYCVGLFGEIENSVQNVGVVDSYFNGCDKIGGICGTNNENGLIQNCYAVCSVDGYGNIGGICGYNNFGMIYNSYAACSVNGESNIGGICGNNTGNAYSSFSIDNCYYDSDVYTGDAIGRNNSYVNNVEGKTTTEFESGEVAYKLNGSTSEGTLVWGQTLAGDKKQTYPVLGGKAVYALTDGYSNTRIVAMTATNDNVPSFENATVYDANDETTTDIAYSDNLKITTVYVKIDGAQDNVKPTIKISCGDDEITSNKWTAAGNTNIYYAQFIGDFDDFGTIEVSYDGTDSVTVQTSASSDEEDL